MIGCIHCAVSSGTFPVGGSGARYCLQHTNVSMVEVAMHSTGRLFYPEGPFSCFRTIVAQQKQRPNSDRLQIFFPVESVE